ncbi:MAG: hypothetical protein WA672_09175 [Candidatus Angelobacter sp.]
MNGLFGSTILDVAVGLIFVYLLLAIICTSLNEWIAGALGLRAKTLELGIRQLLDEQPQPVKPGDPTSTAANKDWLIAEFYKHPLVTGMKKGSQHPSYIPARTFATTLMDIISGPEAPLTFASLQAGINRLPPGDVKTALTSLLRTAGGTLSETRKSIEKWFDDSMDRVSGWYKRKTQLNTVIIALLLAIATNADTLRISSTLWHNPELRAEGVKLAEQRAEAAKNGSETTAANAPTVETTYPDASDPLKPALKPVTQEEKAFLTNLLGWESATNFNGMDSRDHIKAILLMVLGWLLTVIAVSLGAPFWFDVLNKFINIRGSGKAPSELPKTPSKTPIPEPEEQNA